MPATICSNCGTTQGPFDRSLVGHPICKNTKQESNRISECVKRRQTVDSMLFKRLGIEE